MRQVHKPKPAARSRLTKPARNRRSAEQMLVELKLRLREISDLNAAGDMLNWDQATYMPEGGAGAPEAVSLRRSIVWRTSGRSRQRSVGCSTRLTSMARACRTIPTMPA